MPVIPTDRAQTDRRVHADRWHADPGRTVLSLHGVVIGQAAVLLIEDREQEGTRHGRQ